MKTHGLNAILKIINLNMNLITNMIMTPRTSLDHRYAWQQTILKHLSPILDAVYKTNNEQSNTNSLKNLVKFPKVCHKSQHEIQRKLISNLIIFIKYMNHKVNNYSKSKFMYSSFTCSNLHHKYYHYTPRILS